MLHCLFSATKGGSHQPESFVSTDDKGRQTGAGQVVLVVLIVVVMVVVLVVIVMVGVLVVMVMVVVLVVAVVAVVLLLVAVS